MCRWEFHMQLNFYFLLFRQTMDYKTRWKARAIHERNFNFTINCVMSSMLWIVAGFLFFISLDERKKMFTKIKPKFKTKWKSKERSWWKCIKFKWLISNSSSSREWTHNNKTKKLKTTSVRYKSEYEMRVIKMDFL